MKREFKKYDVVRTTETVAGEFGTLRKGRKGTIVEIYKSKTNTGYEVEFCSRTKQPTVITLHAKQIALPKPSLIGSVTELTRKTVSVTAAKRAGKIAASSLPPKQRQKKTK